MGTLRKKLHNRDGAKMLVVVMLVEMLTVSDGTIGEISSSLLNLTKKFTHIYMTPTTIPYPNIV